MRSKQYVMSQEFPAATRIIPATKQIVTNSPLIFMTLTYLIIFATLSVAAVYGLKSDSTENRTDL
jgi:hypothetical protein